MDDDVRRFLLGLCGAILWTEFILFVLAWIVDPLRWQFWDNFGRAWHGIGNQDVDFVTVYNQFSLVVVALTILGLAIVGLAFIVTFDNWMWAIGFGLHILGGVMLYFFFRSWMPEAARHEAWLKIEATYHKLPFL